MSAKLPEVGEFWEAFSSGYRHEVLFVENNSCLTKVASGVWCVNQASVIATDWKYLPWCKSFSDFEPPKPEMETVVFYEVVITGGTSGRYIDWVEHPQSRHVATGRTETRELPKR